MTRRHQFTSESVSMGHPDKVADRIADAVLDHVLAEHPDGRVACEILITGSHVVVAGEISEAHMPSEAAIDEIVRSTVRAIPYDTDTGFDADGAEVHNFLQPQSADIARGVDRRYDGRMGAGDQGMMFGHAVEGTGALMPLPITLAHALMIRQSEVRASGRIEGIRPDAKAQVTVFYENRSPVGLASVLLSTQHAPCWNDRQEELKKSVVEHIVRPALGTWWHDDLEVLVNPTGQFETGGPAADTGLTGRKIIVDTYGGWGRHGGGAFSGKDPSKVDRSASYMARYIAKNLVAAGLAGEIEVRLSYAIGEPDPTSVSIDSHGTAVIPDERIEELVTERFSLSPDGIIETLALARPIYVPTSYHGHFGRTPDEGGSGTFTWELTDRAESLAAAAGSAAATRS